MNVVKRVVGVPGDTLEMVDNQMHLNGRTLAEPHVNKTDPTLDPEDPRMRAWQVNHFVGDDRGSYRPTLKNWGPLVVPAEPLCGATAPITLAGNLVVNCVDTLTGVMLAQLVNPGTPVLFGCISSITDLRDMKYLAGAVEMGLLNAAASQMAQFYEIPIYATAGMSDSKVNDAHAGYESAQTRKAIK